MNHWRLISLAVLALLLPSESFAEGVRVEDAIVFEPPPNAGVAAAYFTLRNDNASPLVIVGAEGSCAESMSIHRSVLEDGIARMIGVHRVPVGAARSVEFQPGGLHVMLEDPALPPGETCEFDLLLESDRRIPVRARITARSEAAPHVSQRGDSK